MRPTQLVKAAIVKTAKGKPFACITAALALSGVVVASAFLSYKHLSVGCDDRDAAFIDAQSGHLRRLDRGSANGRVVFLGSSTFQGLDVSSITPLGLNLSMGGDTLPNLVKRSAGYRSLATARAVVINVGLNDLLKRCVLPETTIQVLFSLIPANTPVVVVGVQEIPGTETARPCNGKRLSLLISELNSQLSQSCNQRNTCRFVPNPVTFALDESARKERLETDGIHLSPAGYTRLSSDIRSALASVANAANINLPPPFPAEPTQ